MPGKRLGPLCRQLGLFAGGRSVAHTLAAGHKLVSQLAGAGRQALKACLECRERRWRSRGNGFQLLAKCRQRARRNATHRSRLSYLLDENPIGVTQAVEQPGSQQPFIAEGEQTRAQGQQVASQVAAVHRRDIAWRQWLQSLRVVPVVEMPAVLLKLVERAQGVSRALDELAGRQIAEVIRRQICQQRHADVGRRGPVRDRGDAIVLIVVWRQPVVLGADQLLEEGPGPPRKRAQEEDLRGSQGRLAASERQTDPPGDDR